MNINFHIEKLILDETCIDPQHIKLLKDAVELELKRLIINQGINYDMKSYNRQSSIMGHFFSIENITNPSVTGRQIGSTLYGGFRK